MKKAILEIFKTDSKTLKYLGKRMDLSDDEFLEAATKQRPSNKKLKEFIAGRREWQESVTEEDAVEVKSKPEVEFEFDDTTGLNAYKKEIMDIFKNDKKRYRFLELRLDFTDEEFLMAAIKKRPNNERLKELVAEYHTSARVEDEKLKKVEAFKKAFQPDPEYVETEEESNEAWEAVDAGVEDDIQQKYNDYKDDMQDERMGLNQEDMNEIDDALQNPVDDDRSIFTKTVDALFGIFANDKGTKRKIEKAVETEISTDDLFEVVRKARPSNAKLKALREEYESFGNTVEEAQEIIDSMDDEDLKAVVEDMGKRVRIPNSELEDDDDDDEMMITENILDKYKDKKITTADVPMPDILKTLREIFANDKGTLKAINKNCEVVSEDDLIEMCIGRRPKNVKLKALMTEVSLAREALEEEEDAADAQKIFEGDENIVSEYQARRMMKVDSIPYVMNDEKNITMFIAGDMEVINSEHPNFKKIVDCLENEKWNDVFPLLDLRAGIAKLVYKQLEFKNDTLYHNGEELHGALVDFIISMVHAGEKDVQPFMRFLHKLLKNPSTRAQKELYGFLASGKIPINEKGNILTYKRIRENWTDCHSGKFDNSVGNVVSMERAQVVDDQTITCAQGLHVCSYSYLASFGGGRTVVCEVNPKDVVSIPTDYKNAKMRCCKYAVLKEVKNNGEDVLSEKPIYW